MAPLHRLHSPLDQHSPQDRQGTPADDGTPGRAPTRPRARRRAILVAAAFLAALMAAPLLPAAAAPGEDVARAARDAVRDEVERIGKRVAEAEETLERMTLEAEAAADAVLVSRTELAAARRDAEARAAALAEAEQAVEETQEDVAGLGREAYMSGDRMGSVAVLLDSDGPGELLQRAATLETLGADRARTLVRLEVVEAEHARADRAAREAVAARDEAARVAAEAEKKANGRMVEAQRAFDEMAAEKAELDAQLKEAEIKLLALENAPDPAQTWARERAAEDATEAASRAVRSSGGSAALTAGRVTSCFGARWGTMHSGVDVAAPIGTPVHTPEAGIVLQAGPASGFGQAVYIQHGDGTITLYGHVSRFHVSAGQTVTAGQRVADVGNEGQSTGPHLHFEVHSGGLYANRVNPMPWLSARGISLGGC